MFEPSQTTNQGSLHFKTPGATGAVPVQDKTGQLVARGEERIGNTTTMPMSDGRLSTMNSFLPAEIAHNSMAVQQRLQISEFQFDKFFTLSTFSCWKKDSNPGKFLFWFSLGGYVMDQRCRGIIS